MQVLDQEQDTGSGVGAADADVVEPAVVAEGDEPGGVDAVSADAGPRVSAVRSPGLALGRAA